MKQIIYLLPFLFFFSASAQIAGYPDFELVESIPIETTLDNPEIRNTLEVWLEMIGSAKKSLDIEQFYISTQRGEPLEDVLQAIVAAGKRGVRVRVIADRRMSATYPDAIERLKQSPNIETRILDFNRFGGGIQHAKFFIIDGAEIFLGSQNFDWRALKHIHELGLRIRHPQAVKVYLDVFNLDWTLASVSATGEARFQASDYVRLQHYAVPFRIGGDTGQQLEFIPTASPTGWIADPDLWDEPNIVRLMDQATSEISMQFLSYSPLSRENTGYDKLDGTIRRAAARGVKVRMIVSDWQKATKAEASLKQLAAVPNVELKYSAIPEWSGGYISFARVEHCKFILVDRRNFWLGTSNGEKSYFHTSRNIGVIVGNEKLGNILSKVFYRSWDGPYTERITVDGVYRARDHGEK